MHILCTRAKLGSQYMCLFMLEALIILQND